MKTIQQRLTEFEKAAKQIENVVRAGEVYTITTMLTVEQREGLAQDYDEDQQEPK